MAQQQPQHEFHDNGSEIYVVDYYKDHSPPHSHSQYPPHSHSQLNHHGYDRDYSPAGLSDIKQYKSPSVFSEQSSVKTSRKGGVIVETMSAPNPCCPNTRGVCCLLLLINLALILLTLGFSIVLQLFYPPFVWYCGILFIIVGFLALITSLLLLTSLCRESPSPSSLGESSWTHHWQKRIQV